MGVEGSYFCSHGFVENLVFLSDTAPIRGFPEMGMPYKWMCCFHVFLMENPTESMDEQGYNLHFYSISPFARNWTQFTQMSALFDTPTVTMACLGNLGIAHFETNPGSRCWSMLVETTPLSHDIQIIFH